ncbi:hypothetical protein Poly51_60220 [Rubripirellula tenax]|uniref:Uncharacterized protein n=1 Tax=Rubripirellula tenax TaxID=2528015 RepID=A0A5C6EA13_9BACT|nr:hypothetical protein Poly51_60220 [Rubripirellula tenax]
MTSSNSANVMQIRSASPIEVVGTLDSPFSLRPMVALRFINDLSIGRLYTFAVGKRNGGCCLYGSISCDPHLCRKLLVNLLV